MNRTSKTNLPAPSRGILAQVAREVGISHTAVSKRYYNGHPATVARVAELEKEKRKADRAAIRKLAKALGA